MKIKLLCILSICFCLAYPKQDIVYVTVPKCGTHLTRKVISELITPEKFNERLLIQRHLTPKAETYLRKPQYKKIVVIRDPRDMFISMVHFLRTNSWFGAVDTDAYNSLSHNEQVDFVLNFKSRYSIKSFFRRALKWVKKPDVLVIRFEDIVGEKGGGNRSKQIETYKKILAFIGEEASDELIERVADTSFGHGAMFRKGLIGQWRTELTEKQTEKLRSLVGKELILLGYEKDNNW